MVYIENSELRPQMEAQMAAAQSLVNGSVLNKIPHGYALNHRLGATSKGGRHLSSEILPPTQTPSGPNEWVTYYDQAKSQGFMDAQYSMSPDEIKSIRRLVTNVLQWVPVSGKFMSTHDPGRGLLKYSHEQTVDVEPPRPTLNFRGGIVKSTMVKEVTEQFLGLDYDMHIGMTELDRINNNNVGTVKLSQNKWQRDMVELTASLAKYREWMIFRGTDIPNFPDMGLNGLVNDTNLTDPGAVGNADSLVTAPNVFVAATDLAQALIKAQFRPPFALMLTPGALMQSIKNKNATTSKTDWEFIKDMANTLSGEGKMFSMVEMCPFLIDTETETNTTAAMMACQPTHLGQPCFEVVETYPLNYYPKPPTSLGIDGKLLWMGRSVIYRYTSIAYADALTVDTL